MELCADDYAVADCAALPAELSEHRVAADSDDEFDPEIIEWLEFLLQDATVLLALEQCSNEGVLLPWDMRGVRLITAPDESIAQLHRFWDHCPKHAYVILSHYVFWLVRAERGRRRGRPDWSPKSALPPAAEVERAIFRPSRLVVRRYSG